MKKNILTIVILAVMLVNFVLTALLVFVMVPASSKTNKLMSQVASIIDLEIEKTDDEEVEISIEDRETYTIESEVLINMKNSEGSDKEHIASMKNISIVMNKKCKEYSKLQPTIQTSSSIITDIIRNVFHNYTVEEAKENESAIKQEILDKLKEKYVEGFIIDISFGNLAYQ